MRRNLGRPSTAQLNLQKKQGPGRWDPALKFSPRRSLNSAGVLRAQTPCPREPARIAAQGDRLPVMVGESDAARGAELPHVSRSDSVQGSPKDSERA